MISYSNILYVFNKVKSKCHNKDRFMSFVRYKNCFLIDILEKLRNNSYSFSNYHIFLIHEKKYRIIMSENISDKIVNQLVSYFILIPSFKCLIEENIATRKGKGSNYGYMLFEKYINDIGTNNNINSLINKEINRINYLKTRSNEKNKLINELKSIPLYRKGYGLSIGCLTNQLLACFFLNDIDHYIKEVLRCKYYIRYMDDIYILSNDKEYLVYCFDKIKYELNKIELNINNKSGIYRLKGGVVFLGYTYNLTNNKLFVRYDNNTIKMIRRKLKYLYDNDFDYYYRSISSYKGYFIRCNTNLFFDKYYYLCINSNYDKYRIIKEKYNGYIIFIKVKDRYYTYDDDLLYMNNLFDIKYYYFRYSRLFNIKVNYVILDSNKIIIN